MTMEEFGQDVLLFRQNYRNQDYKHQEMVLGLSPGQNIFCNLEISRRRRRYLGEDT
jgi:hypothetical protein